MKTLRKIYSLSRLLAAVFVAPMAIGGFALVMGQPPPGRWLGAMFLAAYALIIGPPIWFGLECAMDRIEERGQ